MHGARNAGRSASLGACGGVHGAVPCSCPPTRPSLPSPVPPVPGPAVQDEQSTLQKLSDRLALLRMRKGDLEKRIRELGSLPDEAYEKYRGTSLKKLQAELAQVGRPCEAPA